VGEAMKGLSVPLTLILFVIGFKACAPEQQRTPEQQRQAAIQKQINKDLDKILNQ